SRGPHSFCYHALESHSPTRHPEPGRPESRPALTHLLATDLYFHLSPRLFCARCPGPDPGFFHYDHGGEPSSVCRSQSRPLSFAVIAVAEKFPYRCRCETPPA